MSVAPAALEFHEVASVFPLMEGADFHALREDIREHGQREPILLHDGKIIDGRNRYRACQAIGIEPDYQEWDGEGDLTAFVVSLNLHRRHLTESQRAVVAAKLKPKFEPRARERMIAGKDPVANLPQGDHSAEKGKAREQAAALLNVSPRSVEAASKVLKSGTPELVKAVERGDVKVSTAATVATLPKDEQSFVLSRGPEATRKVAKEIKRSTRDPLDVVMSNLLSVVGSLDAPEGEHSGGWGGFEKVIRSKTPKIRRETRNQLQHIMESIQGWITIIKRLEKERA